MDSGNVTAERWPGGKQRLPFPAFLPCSVLPPQSRAGNYLFFTVWCWRGGFRAQKPEWIFSFEALQCFGAACTEP